VTHLEGGGHVVDAQGQLLDRFEVAVPLGQVQEPPRAVGVLALGAVAQDGPQHGAVSLPPQIARPNPRPAFVVEEQPTPPYLVGRALLAADVTIAVDSSVAVRQAEFLRCHLDALLKRALEQFVHDSWIATALVVALDQPLEVVRIDRPPLIIANRAHEGSRPRAAGADVALMSFSKMCRRREWREERS
jgi:hypothetical protein